MTKASALPKQSRDRELAAPMLLRLRGICKSFGSQTAVVSISLEVARHEVVGLIGENGAGKSSLLKLLTGVHIPDAGTIEVNGRQVSFKTPIEANAAGIGIVHQEQSLFTNLSVAENIVTGTGQGAVRLGIYRWGQVRQQAAAILKRIGAEIDPAAMVGDLSFAQRQMVEIARTIEIARSGASHPADGGAPLVILDEPTSVLEKGETEVLEREIGKLKEIGSVIFVSHRLEEVLRICDRIVVMRHGRIVADRPRAGLTESLLFELMIGEEQKSAGKRAVTTANEISPVLSATGLSLQGVHKVDISVYPGRITAIVGSFGSGRENVCRALFGAEEITSGKLEIKGKSVSSWSTRKAMRAGIAYLPAERGVEGMVGALSAARNLTLAHPQYASVGPFLDPARREKLADAWFEKLDVRPRAPAWPLEGFSGGNQQKVALAKWLLGEPRVLILDHPLRGLDPGSSQTVREQIRLSCQSGCGVLMLADTLEEALDLAHEVIAMRDGEVTARFDMSRDSPSVLELLEKML